MTGPAHAPVTVACSGNWLLGHDRIGPKVLTRIQGRHTGVEICDIGTGALALLDHLHGQALLLVVDACVGMGARGEVLAVEPDLEAPLGRETSVHQIGPVEALVVARHLHPHLMPERVLLLLVETGGLDEDEENAACRRVVELLDAEIAAAQRPRLEERSLQWQSERTCNVFKA